MKTPLRIIGWIKSRLLKPGPKTAAVFRIFGFIPRHVDLIVIVVMAYVLVYGRWLAIVYSFPFNPDEAQAAANALRIKAYGFNWNVLDGSTNGPLDSVVVCWPYLFGLDVTLSTVHLTACILLFFVCLFVYLSVKTLCGRAFAVLFVLPLVLFYAFTGSRDFLHHSSELLPVALLAAANYLTIGISMDRARSGRFHHLRFALLGLLLGAVPFAKIQGVPIAVCIGLYALILAVTGSTGRLRNSIALICAGLAPALSFLLPLLVTGHIQDFWRSYIVWAFLYVKDPLSVSSIYGMIDRDLALTYVSYFFFTIAFLSLLHSSLTPVNANATNRTNRQDVLYGLLLVLVAFWVIAKPGNTFPHYLMFYPPFAVIFCAFLLRAFTGMKRHILLFSLYYVVFAGLFVYLFLSNPSTGRDLRGWHNRPGIMLQQPFEVRSPRILSWLPIPATHMLVWGWMPVWYVWSGLTPATRETNTYVELKDSPLQGYFQSRFMSDLRASSPEVIMDATEGRSFGFDNPSLLFNNASQTGPAVVPEFAAYLSQNYVRIDPWKPEPDCPKLYIKKELKPLVDSRIILPASVTPSASYPGETPDAAGARLFDNSVTEDTCGDYWLLPNGKRGSVDVKLAKVERVSGLMILNTGNSTYLDRAADRVKIKLFKAGSVVGDMNITMKPYPYWTHVDFAAPIQLDQFQVNILSFIGRGGGLNEIKIFRADEPTTGAETPVHP